MKFDLVIFDLDETLVDFRNLEREAFSVAMRHIGFPEVEGHYKQFERVNRSFWVRVEKNEITPADVIKYRGPSFLDQSDPGPPEGVDRDGFTEGYINTLKRPCTILENVIEMLDVLQKNQVKMMILSNGYDEIQRARLKGSPLMRYFSPQMIVVSSAVGCFKPDPKIFDQALKIAGFSEIERDRILIVGDSLSSDILGGKNAEIQTCLANINGCVSSETDPTPDFEIKSLLEVITILDL